MVKVVLGMGLTGGYNRTQPVEEWIMSVLPKVLGGAGSREEGVMETRGRMV